jgi:hypothetical protein
VYDCQRKPSENHKKSDRPRNEGLMEFHYSGSFGLPPSLSSQPEGLDPDFIQNQNLLKQITFYE